MMTTASIPTAVTKFNSAAPTRIRRDINRLLIINHRRGHIHDLRLRRAEDARSKAGRGYVTRIRDRIICGTIVHSVCDEADCGHARKDFPHSGPLAVARLGGLQTGGC